MIVNILIILLYALVALLLLELAFFIIGKFIEIPPKVRSLVYGIVGVAFIIWIVQLVLGGGSVPTLWERSK